MHQDKLITRLKQQVPTTLRGCRLDQVAAKIFPDYSRARLQKWIREGQLCVDDRPGGVRDKLVGGEWLSLEAALTIEGEWQPQAFDLDIVFEDSALLVVNKPAGLVVHPGAGNLDHTLLNGLLHHCSQLASIPRAGIVHRLDKDTTGLLVVAKTLPAHHALVGQLKSRSVSRQYEAVVCGEVEKNGIVDTLIGRHPTVRTRMAVTRSGGKPAITHYRVRSRYNGYSHLKVMLETGRTHQIRVHMAHLGYPLVGDPLYSGRMRLPKGISDDLINTLQGFGRQALHAARLGLIHPDTGHTMAWQAPLPEDMAKLLAALARDQIDCDSGLT